MNGWLWFVDCALFGYWVGLRVATRDWPWWSSLVAAPVLLSSGYWLSEQKVLGTDPRLTGLLVILTLICASAWWTNWCNYKTYRDKMAMVEFLRSHPQLPEWQLLVVAETQISYFTHLQQYLWGRDPLSLYPRQLQDVISRRR